MHSMAIKDEIAYIMAAVSVMLYITSKISTCFIIYAMRDTITPSYHIYTHIIYYYYYYYYYYCVLATTRIYEKASLLVTTTRYTPSAPMPCAYTSIIYHTHQALEKIYLSKHL